MEDTKTLIVTYIDFKGVCVQILNFKIFSVIMVLEFKIYKDQLGMYVLKFIWEWIDKGSLCELGFLN